MEKFVSERTERSVICLYAYGSWEVEAIWRVVIIVRLSRTNTRKLVTMINASITILTRVTSAKINLSTGNLINYHLIFMFNFLLLVHSPFSSTTNVVKRRVERDFRSYFNMTTVACVSCSTWTSISSHLVRTNTVIQARTWKAFIVFHIANITGKP